MNAAAASDAPTSEQLADQARSGDRQAFETLYERHAWAAWGVGLVISDDKLVSSNAVARSFADLLSGPVDAAAHDTFLAALLSQVRKDVLAHDGKAATGLPSLVAEAEAAGQVDETARCFAELPEAWRTWLWLSSVEGIAAADLGAVYHLPTDEADQLAERARDALAKRIAERRSRAVAGAGTGPAVAASSASEDDLADSLRPLILPLPFGLAGTAWAVWAAPDAGAVGAPESSSGRLTALWAAAEPTANKAVAAAAALILAAGLVGVVTVGSGGGSSSPSNSDGGKSGHSTASGGPTTSKTSPILRARRPRFQGQ